MITLTAAPFGIGQPPTSVSVAATRLTCVTDVSQRSVSSITASANHDEGRYDHADEFDIDRPVQNHLAFGTGQHQCLGMHLARLELRVGLDLILERLPNLRLDPEQPPPVIAGLAFRGPLSLPVRFDPS